MSRVERLRTEYRNRSPEGEGRRPQPTDGRTLSAETGRMELANIVPDPNQPRKEFSDEALARLAASLKARGQFQPIRVRWDSGLDKWVIVSGERRYRAAIAAGLSTIACVFAEGATAPKDVLAEQVIENCLREDLKPVEQAQAFRRLMETNGWTQRQVADELNLTQSAVSQALSLLKLPADVQADVDAGIIPDTTAVEISKFDTDADRRAVAARVKAERLDKRAVSALRNVSSGNASQRNAGNQSTTYCFKLHDGAEVVVTFTRPSNPRAAVDALRGALHAALGQIRE